MDNAKGKPGFLKRWARRKATARAASRQTPPPPKPSSHSGAPELPAVEGLDSQSDFTPFLHPQVAPDLRRRALDRLWRLDPLFSRVDGLDDYAGDFTRPAGAAAVATAYRIGRGLAEAADKDEPEGAPSQEDEPDSTPPRQA